MIDGHNYQDPTPDGHSGGDPTPDGHHNQDPTPDRQCLQDTIDDGRRCQDPTPDGQRFQDPTLDGHSGEDPTPDIHIYTQCFQDPTPDRHEPVVCWKHRRNTGGSSSCTSASRSSAADIDIHRPAKHRGGSLRPFVKAWVQPKIASHAWYTGRALSRQTLMHLATEPK